MISNYEIRENSLTKNSVFLLLVKADEQGRDSIQRELSSFCNLIDKKVKGFDYVFELSGITDDTMLEKIRTRLDFISSSVFGVTQTFGNLSNTKTMNIEQTMGTESLKFKTISTNFGKEIKNNMEKPSQNVNKENKEEQGLPVIKLSSVDFPASQEQKEEMNFKDIQVGKALVSEDEKEIEIGETSLKIEKTFTNIEKEKPQINIPKIEEITPVEEVSMPEIKNDVEEENKTILSFSPEEMKNVTIAIEKEKKGLFKNLFGKIKSAVHSGKNSKEKKSKKNSCKNLHIL